MNIAYSTLACPGWTVEQAVEAMKRYGYDAIEWRLADGEPLTSQTPLSVWRRVIKSARQGTAVACLDTSCHFVHATVSERAQVLAEARIMTDFAVEIGAPCIRVFGGALPNGFTRAELLQPVAETLHLAAEYASSRGITLALETHDDWAYSHHALSLIEAAQSSHAALLWDVWHTYRMGESPQQTLQTLHDARSIAHVHVKDAYRSEQATSVWQLCLLEEGEVPIEECLRLLRAVGYQGYVALEWEKKWHPEIEEPEVALPQYLTLLRQYLGR